MLNLVKLWGSDRLRSPYIFTFYDFIPKIFQWLQLVLWIRIRMDPELFSWSGSGIIVPNKAKNERADK